MCKEHLCSPLASRRWCRLPDEGERGWESTYATETSMKRRRWSCCRESAPAGGQGVESSLETHKHTHRTVSTPVSGINVTTSAPAGETDCWGRSPAAPGGGQAFAWSPLVESWCNEPQTGEQIGCFLSWSCPDYRGISGKNPSKSGFAKSHWTTCL